MHHPKSDVNRLFLARTGGDTGLIQLELFYKTTIITSRRCKIPSFTLSKTMTTGYPCTPSADSQLSLELEVPAIPPAEDEANTTCALRTKAKAKHQGHQQLRSRWESKAFMANIYSE